MDLLHCRHDCPLRGPDWRWERARLLLEERARLSPKWDDPWVRRARRFQDALARRGGDPRHPRLGRLDAAVAAACGVRLGEEARPRWELEARVLADQTPGEIADRAGLTVDAVGAYEALFFAVRDRLEQIDWIAAFVLGPRLYEGCSEDDDVDLIWRFFGWAYGANVLDKLLETLYRDPTRAPVAGESAIDRRLAASFRRAIAALTVPLTEACAAMLVAPALRRREVDREAAGAGAAAVSNAVPMTSLALLPPADDASSPVIPPRPGAGVAVEVRPGVCREDGPDLVLKALSFPCPVSIAS